MWHSSGLHFTIVGIGDVKANKFDTRSFSRLFLFCHAYPLWFMLVFFYLTFLPFSVFCNERIANIIPAIIYPFFLCALFVSRDVSVNICCIYKKGVVFIGRKNILCSGIAQSGNSLKEPAWSGVWAPAKKKEWYLSRHFHPRGLRTLPVRCAFGTTCCSYIFEKWLNCYINLLLI